MAIYSEFYHFSLADGNYYAIKPAVANHQKSTLNPFLMFNSSTCFHTFLCATTMDLKHIMDM